MLQETDTRRRVVVSLIIRIPKDDDLPDRNDQDRPAVAQDPKRAGLHMPCDVPCAAEPGNALDVAKCSWRAV